MLAIMRMTAGEITQACGGRMLCGNPETIITSVTADSRQVKPGGLFVPIIGEKTDAHHYIGRVFEAGAAATLTQEHKTGRRWRCLDCRRKHTGRSSENCGRWRRKFTGPVVGITGSVGKTTTKEMTALALSAGLHVMKTEGKPKQPDWSSSYHVSSFSGIRRSRCRDGNERIRRDGTPRGCRGA